MRRKNKFNAFIFILLFAIMLSYGLSYSQNDVWPQFRGPNCSGIANKKSKPPIELNDKNTLWKISLPEGHSSPCIWGDNLFMTGYVKDKSELQIICINRKTGKVKWTQSIFPEKIEGYHPISNAAQTSPATDGARVYVYFGSYGILCYTSNGEFVWDYKIQVHPYRWGVTSSPVIHENKLILSRDIGNERYLMAFNKANGESLWKAELPDLKSPWTTNWATPVVYKNQIVLHRTKEIVGYNIENGERTWWFPCLSGGAGSPIVQNDLIYIGTWQNYSEADQRANFPNYLNFKKLIKDFDSNNDGVIQQAELPDTLYAYIRPEISGMETADGTVKQFFGAFDKNKDNCIQQTEWESTIEWITSTFYQNAGLIALKPDGKGELSEKNIVWRELEKVPEVPSPLYYQNLVYMCKNGGILTCMDASKGTVVFRNRVGAAGPYFASPIAANNYIYFPSGNGVITVIKAGPKLEIVAQSKVNEKIFATPAIAGNTIYVRTTTNLYAFGKD
ncbi:PQQ-binding-like beta-propeller repeat protein [candidate division KSB1 bacterium]|nr:PQQ-binding-like beta-propeller repeat protein [candidate division KSB1 bacterium]